MEQLRNSELLMVSGGGKWSLITGLSMIGVGALFTAVGILSFTPLRPGDVEHHLIKERVVGHAYDTNQHATLVAAEHAGIVRANSPIICGRCPGLANVILWYGVGMVAGGIVALFGSN